jgi:hypothetical protein
MDDGGWIKLHRALLTSPRAKDPEWLAVWIFCLLSACWKPTGALFNGKSVMLQPGQFISSRIEIADATGVKASKVYRVLESMKTDHQIEQQAGAKHSLFTVLNWHSFQSNEQQNGQQLNTNRTTSEQQTPFSPNEIRGFNAPKKERSKEVQSTPKTFFSELKQANAETALLTQEEK